MSLWTDWIETMRSRIAGASDRLPSALQLFGLYSTDATPAADGSSVPLRVGADGHLAVDAVVDTSGLATETTAATLAKESGGNLAAIKGKTDNIPSLGQALAAGSVPVVLTAAQISTLTPLSAVSVSTLPGSPAQEHTAANSPHAARLTDGSAFYKGAVAGDAMGADLRVGGNAVAIGNPVHVAPGTGATWTLGGPALTMVDYINVYSMFDAKAARAVPVGGEKTGSWTSATTTHDLATFLTAASHVDLAGTEVLEIVSSSVQDKGTPVAGTGLRTIELYYADALNGGIWTGIDITLDGTTPVNLGALRANGIAWMYAETADPTGSRVAAGNIDLRVVATGAIVSRIPLGRTRSQDGRVYVPSDRVLYVHSVTMAATGQPMRVLLRGNRHYHHVTLGGVYNSLGDWLVPVNGSIVAPVPAVKFTGGMTVKLSAIPVSTSGSPTCSATMEIAMVNT